MANVSKMPASLTADKSPEEIAWLQGIEKQANAPFTVQSLTPGNTSLSVSTRTISDSANSGTGVDGATVGYNLGNALQSLYDSFTTIKNSLNTLSANDTATQAAVAALNTRVTALEEKINEAIAALS